MIPRLRHIGIPPQVHFECRIHGVPARGSSNRSRTGQAHIPLLGRGFRGLVRARVHTSTRQKRGRRHRGARRKGRWQTEELKCESFSTAWLKEPVKYRERCQSGRRPHRSMFAAQHRGHASFRDLARRPITSARRGVAGCFKEVRFPARRGEISPTAH